MSAAPAYLMMSPAEQLKILLDRTEEVLPEGELHDRLERCRAEKRPLRVKQGFDPTAPDIHLGHAVGLRKLREFQELGHQVVLIVGDYTGMVGDPSGRNKARPQLTEEEVERNAKTYLEQFYRIVERDPAGPLLPVEVHRNGEWFSRMRFMDVMRLASEYTVARMLERDDFSKRFADRQPISIHELFYPLMQGYDSVAIRSDVELGGTEQKFNLLVGRALQELHGLPPQIIMTMPLLPGLDGGQRMGKSLGNYVGVTEAPSEMFGKMMSLSDAAMPVFWRLAAALQGDERAAVEADLAALQRGGDAVHPMTLKKRLAHRIVVLYHGETAAARAQADFDTQFQKKGVPEDLPVVRIDTDKAMGIKDLLVAAKLAKSGSEAWRQVDQGAVSLDGVKITDRNFRWEPSGPAVLRVGRKMVRVEVGSEAADRR
jgi:tyrosyl-tRNA synthetase